MDNSQKTEHILDKIVNTLAEEYEPDQIILFGSQAYGSPDQSSDIDLLIIKNSKATPYQRAIQVRRLLRDPERLIPVDFLIITPTELQERLRRGDQFLQIILAQGKVLYSGTTKVV
jgi:predicted nucleotidyltransferase